MKDIRTVFVIEKLIHPQLDGTTHFVIAHTNSSDGMEQYQVVHWATCEKEAEDVAQSLNDALDRSAFVFDE